MTTNTTTWRTPEQLRHANARSAETRGKRARMRREIASQGRRGALIIAETLLDDSEVIDPLDIGDVLLWIPRVGKPRIGALLHMLQISPWRTVERLTERQRRQIAGRLVAFANGKSL